VIHDINEEVCVLLYGFNIFFVDIDDAERIEMHMG
jgi:hypothetical protein